ncbi:MAG: response regulator, partial [Mesorhizobium sp.]|nr:response regulator [Mesorhizobium sp.]
SIEIWDTGVGIPNSELQAIFDEYHQIDNAARERSRGLGLGLSIVKRLADLLGHRVRVSSKPSRGSVFAIEVPLASDPVAATRGVAARRPPPPHGPETKTGGILVVEDDPEVRGLLQLFLDGEGHRTASAADGVAALDMVARGMSPDLILADYNLPRGMSGLQVALRLRETLGRAIPVIILTGDIATGTLRDIATQNCVQLHKPVKLTELAGAIQRLLPQAGPPADTGPTADLAPPAVAADPVAPDAPVVFVVDDDRQIRDAMRAVFEDDHRQVETFASGEAFLAAYRPDRQGCLVVDGYLPGMTGLDLLRRLRDEGSRLPAIMITGNSDVAMAVAAMKAGASDFIEKPVGHAELLASVEHALEHARDSGKAAARRQSAADRLAGLTERQREIMDLVLAGHPSKNIAADLGISQRTVENHRASIMKKTGSKSLPALARLALAARDGEDGPVT